MLTISDINFQRARFEKVARFYGAQGIAPQLSMLRIEEDLVNGQGTYNFDLKKENLSAVEKNLKRNDLFVTLAIAVAVRIEDKNAPNSSIPMFAPYLAEMQTENGGYSVVKPGFETEDIKALYNGSLYIATGTTVNFADMPCSLFLKDKGTQDKNGKFHHFDLENDMKAMAEEIIFSGTQDHTIKVSFPTFAQSNYNAANTTMIPENGTESDRVTNDDYKAKIVFMALGYRVVGGTLPSYRVDANPYKDCI